MKKIGLTFVFLIVAFAVYCQGEYQGVSIAEDTLPPHRTAALDIRSGNKGLLIPAWTTETRKNAVLSPVDEGLTVFVNDPDPDKRGYWYWVYVEDSLQGYWRKLVIVRQTTYPPGSIIMYTGSLNKFDENGYGITRDLKGWALCDGQLGRPDLSGKFIVGGTHGNLDYDSLNSVGGQNTVTISVDELPPHQHTFNSSISANVDMNHQHEFIVNTQHSHKIKSINTHDSGAGTTCVKEGKTKKKKGTNKNGTMPTSMSSSNVELGAVNIPGVSLPPTLKAGPVVSVDKDNRPPWYVVAYIICIKAGEDFSVPIEVETYPTN